MQFWQKQEKGLGLVAPRLSRAAGQATATSEVKGHGHADPVPADKGRSD